MSWYRAVVRMVFAVAFLGGALVHLYFGLFLPHSYAPFADTVLWPWLAELWRGFVMANIGWLSLLNATLPPIGAVLVADYFARRKTYLIEGENATTIKWAPIVALIAGALTGWLTPGFGIVSINAMVVAILVYFVGSAIEKGIRR